MTALELRHIIWNEVNKNEINSWHGITKDNLGQYLIKPKLIELSVFGGQRNNYWLVFDENPDDKMNGYLVVYDEAEKIFGLAAKTTADVKDIGFLVGCMVHL